MKFKDFLARRSSTTTTTTHSMNPEFMSDEYNIMNRRRSFGRGGAGNIRSREEATTLAPISMSSSITRSMSIRSSMIHKSQHHQHHYLDYELGSGSGDESASNSTDTEPTEPDDTETTEPDERNPKNDDAVHRHDSQRHPTSTSPYQFHYRYHYRHYRPGHFSGGSSSSSGSSSGSSSAWSSMSSLSTGTRGSVVLSGGRGRLLSGMKGMRQVLSGGSGGSGRSGGSGYGHGHNGQSPR